MRGDAAGFLYKSVRYHLLYAPVDTVVQFFTVTGEPYFNDTEGAFLFLPRAERGIGLSCHITDFQGVDYSFMVL